MWHDVKVVEPNEYRKVGTIKSHQSHRLPTQLNLNLVLVAYLALWSILTYNPLSGDRLL